MKWEKILSLLLAMSMTFHPSLAIAAEDSAEENTVQEILIDEDAEAADEAVAEQETQEAAAGETEKMIDGAAEVADEAVAEQETQETAVGKIEKPEETGEESVEETAVQDAITEVAEVVDTKTDVQDVVEKNVTETMTQTVDEDVTTEKVGERSEIAEEGPLEDTIKPVILLDATPSDSRDIRDVHYVSIDRPIEIDGETYQIVMAGIPDQYVDDLVAFITDYYKSVDPEKIEYTGTGNLIDAEKWSVMVSGVDSLHCWAATASNMLWNSGWAKKAINPRTGEPFKSEDEILTFFTSRTTDGLGNTISGIEWFFNALYDLQYDIDEIEGTTAKLKPTSTADEDLNFLDAKDGVLPDLLAEKILHYVVVNGDLSALSILKDLAYNAIDSKSIGLSVHFFDGEKAVGGHAVTAFGIIFDALANSAESMYKAIVLADSDDDADVIPEDLHISNFWEWMKEKETRKNAYQIYHLNPIELGGKVYWEIMDYTGNKKKAVINGLYILDNYTEKTEADITEKEGTCNFRKDYDLSLLKIGMAGDTYEVGEDIEIKLDFTNRSYYGLDPEEIPDIPYTYRIIRDGEVVFTNSSRYEYNRLRPLAYNDKSLTVNLQQAIGSDLPAGTYTMEFTINPYAEDNEIVEAFYQNNTKSITFTITGTEEPETEETETQEPETEEPETEETETQEPETEEPETEETETQEPETEETETDSVIHDTEKPVEEKKPSYVTIPANLIHVLEVENDGEWDLTKEEEKDYFTVKVFHPAGEFLDIFEIIKDEMGHTEEIKVEKENYRIVDNNETFTIEFSKDYLRSLDEGKHTFAISLMSLFEKRTFDIEIKK